MNRSSVARFRCGSALTLALSSLALHAQALPPLEDEDWLKRSREILDRAVQQTPPEWLRSQPDAQALAAAEAVAREVLGPTPRAEAAPIPGRVLIFASFSIPPATLKNLLDQATEPNVVLVFRGVPKGSNVSETVRRLKRMLPREAHVPHVLLDPTLFRRYGIDRVPSFVLERESQHKAITAVGAVNTTWLRRMAASVKAGQEHLGQRAESYEIAETDLILEMQQRLASIDWTARREAAMRNFWNKRQGTFVDLPESRERQEFLVDPSVRVTEDLEDADGNLLVAAGQTFNPLAWAPLSKTIVVFRGTDPKQVATAAELARAARVGGRGVILLTTDLETTRGWAHLSELESRLAGAVYVLPETLVERFHLKRIPATVAARGKQLLITEIPVGATP